MPHTAAVIGLGKMGLGYDYDLDHTEYILTHASGFYNHNEFKLVGGVDPDKERRRLFTTRYQLPAFATIESLLQEISPDVIAVATPTKHHYETLKTALKATPKAIICEKPFTDQSVFAKEIISIAKQKNCALLINYIRRFDPGVLKIKKLLEIEAIGSLYKIIITYSRGLLNNGSHFIDLIQFLCGEIAEFKSIKNSKHDDNIDVFLQLENTACFLLATNNNVSIYEMIMIGTEGMIRYEGGGECIRMQKLTADKTFSDYMTLSSEVHEIENDMKRYQWHACENLHQHLQYQKPLHSNADDALKTLSIIETLLNGTNQ